MNGYSESHRCHQMECFVYSRRDSEKRAEMMSSWGGCGCCNNDDDDVISSPLPDQSRRIYERGHAHSRSWNPEGQPSPPPLLNPNPYRFFEPQLIMPKRSTAEVQNLRRIDVPIINEPPTATPHLHERRRSHVMPRQAKSFENRPVERRIALDNRSYTLQSAAEVEKEEVSAACQSLWAAKGHLEQLDALGISEPSSVSTSFESNTDSQVTADTVERQSGQMAKAKRTVFKNILLQRQFLSTAAVSSMESNNSTDDSDPRFSNSFDSTRSELGVAMVTLYQSLEKDCQNKQSQEQFQVIINSYKKCFSEFNQILDNLWMAKSDIEQNVELELEPDFRQVTQSCISLFNNIGNIELDGSHNEEAILERLDTVKSIASEIFNTLNEIKLKISQYKKNRSSRTKDTHDLERFVELNQLPCVEKKCANETDYSISELIELLKQLYSKLGKHILKIKLPDSSSFDEKLSLLWSQNLQVNQDRNEKPSLEKLKKNAETEMK
uniref:Uncharacterized protein n=1 Tax=Caenorhabditis japonica TaxID=281687 RepID=A0A8R1I8M8_CAEJA